MIKAVGKHRVAAPHQGRHHTQVGHIAGREKQGARQRDKCRQRLLQLVMGGGMPEDQMRGTSPHAIAMDALDHSVAQTRIGGQSQIVVAAKRNQLATVNGGLRLLWRLQKPPAAQQSL